MSKKPRELPEMVEALARQTRLLNAHLIRAQTDPDYWGEVASKLRLLLVERPGSNSALLFHVARKYQTRLGFELRPDGGPLTWEELLDQPMLKLGDKSTGENSITFRNVICAWAEQQGGVHEDWRVDEMLLKTQTSAFGEVGGKRVSIARINMTAIASKAIESANRLLDGIRRLERLRAK